MDFSGNMFREFANDDLSKNKEKYFEFAECARKLNSKEIDLECDKFFIDCLHQPYKGRNEYNHVDAYFLSQVLSKYYEGKILFAKLKTTDVAKKDKKEKLNNEILASATPFHGELIDYDSRFIGGNDFCDGHLDFSGRVEFINNQNNLFDIEKFSGLLEVGHTDIATTWVHLFINCGQLARFPYGHKMVGLFIKTDFEYPMPDYS